MYYYYAGVSLSQRLDGFASAALISWEHSLISASKVTPGNEDGLDAPARERIAKEQWDEWNAIITGGAKSKYLTSDGYRAIKQLLDVADREAEECFDQIKHLKSRLRDDGVSVDDDDLLSTQLRARFDQPSGSEIGDRLPSGRDMLVQASIDMEDRYFFWRLRHEALHDFLSLAEEGVVMPWQQVRELAPAIPKPKTYTERQLEYFRSVLEIEGDDSFDPETGMMQYFTQVAEIASGDVTPNAVYDVLTNCGAWIKGNRLGQGRERLERIAREALGTSSRSGLKSDPNKE